MAALSNRSRRLGDIRPLLPALSSLRLVAPGVATGAGRPHRARGDGSHITMRYRVRRWLFLVVLLYRMFGAAPLPQMEQLLLLISSGILLLGALGMRSTLQEADEDLKMLLAAVEQAAGRSG
jgi:hypothetical protein